MNTRDPHSAVNAYNRLAQHEGWQSVCHAALDFQREELHAVLEIWNWLATENGVPRRKSLTPRLLRTHLANVAIYECVENGRWRARLTTAP